MVKWRGQVSMARKRRPSKQQCDKLATNLWCLPNEILVHILRSLHIKDLLNVKSTHSFFCDLIDSHTSIWTSVSFTDVWPSKLNLKYFERAAKNGNIEALIKLGVAYLYNEGLPGDFEGRKITVNGERAAKMFCQAETQLSGIVPFTFLFIRPPWSALTRGACCKEYVFNNMVEYVKKIPVASVHQSIARTLSLLEETSCQYRMVYHLKMAAELGSSHAKYILWQKKYYDMQYPSIRQKVHELSLFAVDGCSIGSKLELCRAYAKGHYGKLNQAQAAAFMSKFIQCSKPTHINKMFDFQELTHSMRYILMDWLVEVANMKDYCSLTLHLAIHAVDRFLMSQRTTRAQLQLLGVSAMVLCSRFLGKDIITIREAAWLTDNTYKYEDVVRMMGEITATLRGNFRVLTSLDYVQVISLCSDIDNKPDNKCCMFSEYICELALLQSDLGEIPQGKVASVCVLLARVMFGKEQIWTKKLEQFTGFTLEDIKHCVADVHKRCFGEPAMTDHRSIELEAVKHRYADEEYMEVSDVPVIKHSQLCKILGIVYPKPDEVQTLALLQNEQMTEHKDVPVEIIVSPSRSRPKPNLERNINSPSKENEKNVTPILEKKLSSSGLNDLSGYLGDKEDEDESNLLLHDDSDLDLESLWCVDNIDVSYEMAAADDEDNTCDRTLTLVDREASECAIEKVEKSSANNIVSLETLDSQVLDDNIKDLDERQQFDNSLFTNQPDESDENILLASPNTSLYNLSPQISSVGLVSNNFGNSDVHKNASNVSKNLSNSHISGQSTNAFENNNCNASPTPSTSLLTNFNGSPIGGMNLFKVDTPNSTRYINSGIKIDFSNRKKANLSVLNLGNKRANSPLQRRTMLDTLSKSPKLTKRSTKEYSPKNPKHQRSLSKNQSHALGKSTSNSSSSEESLFRIYEDNATQNEMDNTSKVSDSCSSTTSTMVYVKQSLKERNLNIRDTQKRSKKRKPSISIGNEEKVQVISNI